MKKNGRRKPKKSQTRILKAWEAPSFYAHFSKPMHLEGPLPFGTYARVFHPSSTNPHLF